MDKNNFDVLILLSGGLDSTACVHYYRDLNFKIKLIFVDYGQNASQMEFNSASNISDYYGIKLDYIKFSSAQKYSDGEIRGRNAFLVMAVLLAYPTANGLISIGIHSGTFYYDCSESFVKKINSILCDYTNGQLILDTPFLKWDKKMIFNYCRGHNLEIQ